MSTTSDPESGGQEVQWLGRLAEGTKATVVRLAGGRALQNRLVSMGLTVGSDIEVVRSSRASGGPTLVAAGGTRLAIGRGMADKIEVTVRSD